MGKHGFSYHHRRRLRPWVWQALLVAFGFCLATWVLGEGNRADDARIRQQIARWQSTYVLARERR